MSYGNRLLELLGAMISVMVVVWILVVYPSFGGIDPRLTGKLHRVGFQLDCWRSVMPPAAGCENLKIDEMISRSRNLASTSWTDDPAFLARVEEWLESLRRPTGIEKGLRMRDSRLVLEFTDGRREYLLFFYTILPGTDKESCWGFLWDGHEVEYADEPFSVYLSEGTSANILNHCCQPEEHIHGCWVMDWILGKE
jgi:hypothetical protein